MAPSSGGWTKQTGLSVPHRIAAHLSAQITFCVLDEITPTIGNHMKFIALLGIGSSLGLVMRFMSKLLRQVLVLLVFSVRLCGQVCLFGRRSREPQLSVDAAESIVIFGRIGSQPNANLQPVARFRESFCPFECMPE